MSQDIPSTLLNIFSAMLQIIILYSVGIITGLKKVWNPKSIKAISELLYNYFIPLYSIYELAKMASWPNVEIMWILIISVVFAIFLGFGIGVVIHKAFGMDVRFTRSYPFLISMPSLGTVPLVLGRALCYPGGMLEGDPQCPSILGFMVMNKLIFNIILFVMGFILIPKDANFTNVLLEKMSYVWHNLIGKVYDKNYAVLNIFLRFMKNEKTTRELFEIFDKRYKLAVSDKDNLHFSYEFIVNQEVQLNFVLDEPHLAHHLDYRSKLGLAEVEVIKEEHVNKNSVQNNSYFEKPQEQSSERDSSNEESEIIGNSINFVQNELAPETLSNYIPKARVLSIDSIFYTKANLNSARDKFVNIEIPDNKQIKESAEDEMDSDLLFPSRMNYMLEEYIEAEYIEAEPQVERMSMAEEKKIINEIKIQRESSVKIFANDVERYYQKVFGFVEKHFNEEKASEYNEFKLTTLKAVFGIPPKFPLARDVTITSDVVKVVEEEWTKLETSMKKINPEFKLLTPKYSFNMNVILKELHSPPVISSFLGLLIGMSGMREVMFSSNHYITNLLDGLYMIILPTVPFLYLALGIFMISVKNGNRLNTPLTLKYILLTFLHRFMIMPAIGLLYVYLWQTYFGGIVAASKVFRVSLFIPFCLPCTVTIIVIINMVKFFTEETGIILFSHNSSILFTLTILYLIYYVVIG
jgi:predicted permease